MHYIYWVFERFAALKLNVTLILALTLILTLNLLTNEVVEANTVNAFKYRLDKHWSNQEVLFDFNTDLIGTGSVPICR